MAEAPRFRINTPTVVHETIDDEVVIIDFDTGAYFSLGPVGARVWRGIDKCDCAQEIAAAIRREFACADADVGADVARLLDEFRREKLIVPLENGAQSRSPSAADVAAASDSAASRPYTAPVLHKYTDMQELLLLDPIHEVDETGWPRVQQDGSG